MYEYKCKHCKKCYTGYLKGYYHCELTGSIRANRCTNFWHPECKNFELNWFDRFWDWLDEITT